MYLYTPITLISNLYLDLTFETLVVSKLRLDYVAGFLFAFGIAILVSSTTRCGFLFGFGIAILVSVQLGYGILDS